jgi:hypothetical protein
LRRALVNKRPNLNLNLSPAERTIASNDEELIVVGKVVNGHVGVRRDNLKLGGKLGALLEFEIANGTRQGKVAVDTTKVDETAGSRNARLFACERNTQLLATALLHLLWSTWERHPMCNIPSFWGLWSNDSGFARPLTPSTALESPALA